MLDLPGYQRPPFGRGRTRRECTSDALVHAHQQLHPHGDAGVPAQRQQADITGHDRWTQQVLHCGGAVGVPVKDLCKSVKKVHKLKSSRPFQCFTKSGIYNQTLNIALLNTLRGFTWSCKTECHKTLLDQRVSGSSPLLLLLHYIVASSPNTGLCLWLLFKHCWNSGVQ